MERAARTTEVRRRRRHAARRSCRRAGL